MGNILLRRIYGKSEKNPSTDELLNVITAALSFISQQQILRNHTSIWFSCLLIMIRKLPSKVSLSLLRSHIKV